MNQYSIAALLQNNSYAGRGIILGQTPDGEQAVTAYFIMGRSINSRNRVFVADGDDLRIEPFDVSKVEDPSLIIYWPWRVLGQRLIVSNGDQTDTIYQGLQRGFSFEDALDSRTYEPDAPNFTPRISGLVNWSGNFDYRLNILKREDENGACGRYTYRYQPTPGKGHFIHTYIQDGNPLPSFSGEPEPVNVENDIDVYTKLLWEGLNPENKISLAVRYIRLTDGAFTTRILNKNQ